MAIARCAMGLVLLLLFCHPIAGLRQTEQKLGFLIINVTDGENKSPSRGVFVFLRSYRPVFRGESSTILEPTFDGHFETALLPGLYDVFVSRADLLPTCRRVQIVAGQTEHYTANLTIDGEHLEK